MGSECEPGAEQAPGRDPDTKTPVMDTPASAPERIRHLLHRFNLGFPLAVGAATATLAFRGGTALAQQFEAAEESQADEQHVGVTQPAEELENSDSQQEDAATAVRATPRGPDGGEFYYPQELPGESGEVVWQREVELFSLPGRRMNARAWQVVYQSTSALGEAVPVSGTIIVPPGGATVETPLVSFASGTQGMADRCAPSELLRQGLDYEGPLVQDLVRRGWAVAITDYQGLGTDGEHPYVVGQALGRNVLDMARAAIRLPEAGLSSTTKVGVWGYSEGGAAAAWAGQLQLEYAPDLQLMAVAAGGIPADLTKVARYVNGGPFSGLQMMAAIGLDEAYPELDLDAKLNARGVTQREMLRQSCLFDGLLRTANTRASQTTNTDVLQDPSWIVRMEENKLGKLAIKVPTYLYHGLFDQAVPYGQAKSLRDMYCRQGMQVMWSTHALAEHITALYAGAGQAMSFLTAGFNGQPSPNNCRQRWPWLR